MASSSGCTAPADESTCAWAMFSPRRSSSFQVISLVSVALLPSGFTDDARSALTQTRLRKLAIPPPARMPAMALRKSWLRRRSAATKQRTSACIRVYSSSRAVDQVLRPTDTAPICWMAKNVSSHSARLPMRMATRSPRTTPMATSPRATLFACSRSCEYVKRRVPSTSASWDAKRLACSFISIGMVRVSGMLMAL